MTLQLPTNRPPAVPPRVVVYGTLLCISLIVLGGIGAFFVKDLNRSYEAILNRELPALTIMRDVSQSYVVSRRSLDMLPARPTAEELKQAEAQISHIREKNSERLAQLGQLYSSTKGMDLLSRVREERKKARGKVDDYLKRLSEGMDEAEYLIWRRQINDSGGEYMEAQDRLAEFCSQSANQAAGQLVVRTKIGTAIFLLVACWPLILGGALLVLGIARALIAYRKSKSRS